jgi:predicted TIM-barrel fold metal-dependent hydrolase
MPVQAIDAWAQLAFRNGRQVLPEVVRLFEKSGTSDFLDRDLTADELIALMDAGHIEKAMLTAWCGPRGWISSNERIADIVRQRPDRLFGVATVNLANPREAVLEFRRAISEYGFKALRIIPWLWNLPPNDKHYYPLYVACIELGIPFCTQVGHTGPLMPSETGRPVPYLDEVALTFPELTIVGGHIGYPWTAEMVGLTWKHDNVYIDTSAYLPKYYPPELVHFIKTYGQDKVLFGTNFPMLTFERCRSQVADLDLPPDVEEKFLRTNAERVFKLG